MAHPTRDNLSGFDRAIEAAFTAGPAPNEAQAAAYDRYARMRLPNRRLEGWRWSDFHAALRDATEGNVGAQAIPSSAFTALEPLEFRIIDGRPERPKEILDGLEYGVVEPMATIPDLEPHPIVSLNVAMAEKAIGITVKEGVNLQRPLLIRHIRTGAAPAFGKTLIRLCEGASAQLIESYEGAGSGFYSHLSHVDLRDGAALKRFVMQDARPDAVAHSLFAVKVEKSKFSQVSFSTGARLSRHETVLHFMADGGRAYLNSAALVAADRHCDFTTLVRHCARNCAVRQMHKGVATGNGRTVFQGKFLVERGAQKTDAKMTANALLLSDGAEANHKPELEIYADDVECAHGSTVGALDDKALFYLRQRGLSEAQAKALLIEAFVNEVIGGIEGEDLRAVFADRISNWLEAAS